MNYSEKKIFIYIYNNEEYKVLKQNKIQKQRKIKKIGVLLSFRLVCSSTGLSSLLSFSR